MVSVFSPSTWSMTRSTSPSGSGSSCCWSCLSSTWSGGDTCHSRSSYYKRFYFRLCTLFSPEVRIAYLKSIAPSLSLRTCRYLKNVLGFGDWLILAMMSQHLDIKLFTDILQEIKNVSFMHKRSISTTIDIIHASDTDGENDDKDDLKPTPIITPMLLRKPSNLALKKVK